MTIRLRLFAVAKDLAGFHEKHIELPDASTAGDVLAHLANIDSRFSRWGSCMRLAVNQEYVGPDHKLCHDDEVAVIPPVSGG
ncbi:MAG: molybdopterin converting factor subunit 1 [Ignavibacteria bacterium]|nr:molybdopterin converting factor subunit 1 [Ignavibacteria bacterium]